jgi:hypothetical protein
MPITLWGSGDCLRYAIVTCISVFSPRYICMIQYGTMVDVLLTFFFLYLECCTKFVNIARHSGCAPFAAVFSLLEIPVDKDPIMFSLE